MAEFYKLTLDAAVPPEWIVGGHANDDFLDFACSGRALGLPARRVNPFALDQSAVPGQECRGAHGEDFGPASAGDERGQGGEPEPIGRLIADLGDLPAQDDVLMAQHEKLGILGYIAAYHRGQSTEEFAGDPVSDGDQRPTMLLAPKEKRSHYAPIAQIRTTEPHRIEGEASVTARNCSSD